MRTRRLPKLSRRAIAVGVLVTASLLTTPTAFADSPGWPFSYQQVAPGGTFVFVMIAPAAVEDETRRWNEQFADKIRAVRRVYSRSGLYRNDGSTEPLWTVDWYAFAVDVTPDGVHTIRHGPWPSLGTDRDAPRGTALDQEAFSFFENGRLLRTVAIRDVIDDPSQLERSVSHFRWLESDRFDPARAEYRLTAKDGNRFVFDARTGAVISEGRAAPRGRLLTGVALVGLAAVVVLPAVVWWRRTRRRTR